MMRRALMSGVLPGDLCATAGMVFGHLRRLYSFVRAQSTGERTAPSAQKEREEHDRAKESLTPHKLKFAVMP
jgi:hypothetical protein